MYVRVRARKRKKWEMGLGKGKRVYFLLSHTHSSFGQPKWLNFSLPIFGLKEIKMET